VRPVAIVMNMFYTGLGIARSLGEQGIPVIGLTAHRGIYGNFTRYAKLRSCPDSRERPQALLEFLLLLGEELAERAIIFPTRDDDVIFLDRYREQLQSRYILVLPEGPALKACLDKSETYRSAQAAGVPAPRCWTVASRDDLLGIIPGLRFPCVLKPVSAHHWRQTDNWKIVGCRKAIAVSSPEELLEEYGRVARAHSRALLQEMVEGPDDCLWVAACYLDRQSNFVAGFTAQKLVQVPERFGTGCIVQTADCPELLGRAARLLQSMQFSGIAEVEFKWDASSAQFQLIEINPRPWDQHRMGKICGVDLIHIAYCDSAGLALPPIAPAQKTGQKWIAEDVFCWQFLRLLWKRDKKLGSLLRLARGHRIYAIWSVRDPLPMLGFVTMRFGPEVITTFLRYVRSLMTRSKGAEISRAGGLSYENLEKRNAKN
jgi:D-aspartate ligase